LTRAGPTARANVDVIRQASVGEADDDGADDLLLFACVERLRRVAQRLKLDPAMHVPRTVAGGAAQWNRRNCPEAEITECVIHTGQFVAQSRFSGADANGKAWSITGPVVRLLAK
jgi:hypothetical protein